jgi:hypothetical protein
MPGHLYDEELFCNHCDCVMTDHDNPICPTCQFDNTQVMPIGMFNTSVPNFQIDALLTAHKRVLTAWGVRPSKTRQILPFRIRIKR